MQGRHLEELVEDDVGVGVAFYVYDDAHALSACLVVDVRDAVYFSFLDEVGDVLDELCFVYAVGYLGDDDFVVLLVGLNLCLCSHDDASSSCLVGVAHSL